MSLAAKTGGDVPTRLPPREVAELLRFFGRFQKGDCFFLEGKHEEFQRGGGEKKLRFCVDQLDASMEGGTF